MQGGSKILLYIGIELEIREIHEDGSSNSCQEIETRAILDPSAKLLIPTLLANRAGPRRNEPFISSIFAGFARRRLQNQTNVHKLRQRFTFLEKSVTDRKQDRRDTSHAIQISFDYRLYRSYNRSYNIDPLYASN